MQIKSKNLVKVILIAILGALFVFSIVRSLQRRPSSEYPQNGQQIVIKGNKGKVQLKNFFNQVKEQVGDTMVLAETKDFDIVYFKKDETFSVTLLSKPVTNARDLAENAFLKTLEVDIGQACQLKVIERIPYSVDINLSGQDYGLSFCPNNRSF